MSPVRRGTIVTAILGALVSVSAAAPAGAGQGTHSRIYLLGADTDYLYWSVDPLDPELGLSPIVRTCQIGQPQGIPGMSKPCLSGPAEGGIHSMFFLPATLFDQPLKWSAAEPLRFHLALHVNAALPYTVRLFLWKSEQPTSVISEPATEIAPDVWEGTLTTGSSLSSEEGGFFGIRINTSSPRVTMELQARGASWIDLPRPIAARPVPQLLAESTYAPGPSSFQTDQRAIRFNDDQWEAWSFQGDLSEARTFDVELERDAEFVLAWAEAYDTPFLHDVIRGRPPDDRKLTEAPAVSLIRDGEELALGANHFGWVRGMDSVALIDVSGGPLTLRVEQELGDATYPYSAHVLAVYGARTVRTMRWRFALDAPGVESFRVGGAANCFVGTEPTPTTSEVTTMEAELSWDTVGVGAYRWTIPSDWPNGANFPCGEGGTGNRVRFTLPGAHIWAFSAVPASDAAFVSFQDTIFEMEVRYAYTPPPADAGP